jgi:hypothetical protein
MAGLLDFAARFGTEERCIEHFAGLRWPSGFVCSGCSGRMGWRLKARPDKSLVVAAGREGAVPKNKKGKYRHAVKRSARVLRRQRPDRRAAGRDGRRTRRLPQGERCSPIASPDRRVCRPSRRRRRPRRALKHTPLVQGEAVNTSEFFLIIHTLFSNIKAWLVGTHHGVSAKHLPRYLREWSYRFNRRNLSDGLDGHLIPRAVECATITYDQLPAGADRVRRLPAAVA